MTNDFLTAVEAAAALNLHPGTIKRYCRLGKLKTEKVNSGKEMVPRKGFEPPLPIKGSGF